MDEPVAFHPSGPPTYRSSQLSENGSPFTPGPIGLSLPDRPAYSLPDRLAYSLPVRGLLKRFSVSTSETENCFSEGSEPGPFWEFYIGITIKRGLQRRRCTERH